MNGQIVRLQHFATHRNLHSHTVPGHCTNSQHEVSCYEKNNQGNDGDNWRVEIPHAPQHLVQGAKFRLIHQQTNCALHSHGARYPFQNGQHEVTGFAQRDDNDFFKVTDMGGVVEKGQQQQQQQQRQQADDVRGTRGACFSVSASALFKRPLIKRRRSRQFHCVVLVVVLCWRCLI